MPATVSRRYLLKGATSAAALTLVVPLRTGAVTGTAVVTTDVLRIRSGPGTGYEIIGRTYDGESLTVLEGPTSGFYRVRLGAVEGWVSADYISVTPGAVTGSGTGTTTTRLNLRSGAGTSFGVLLVMPAGAAVTIVSGPVAGWYQLTYQGTTGYASGQYLTIEPGEDPGEPTGSGTATVKQSLNLRSGPGTSYSVVLVMPTAATVTVVSNPGSGWVQITYQGSTGWASAQYLTIGAGSNRTATIGTDVLNLRSAGNTASSVVGQMLYGETVEIASASGDWYKVAYHGKNGYAYGPYLTFGGPSASMWVPIHQQRHSLSCEYASCQIATAGLGKEIDEDRFIPIVGTNPNPHLGFRGNIDGEFIYGYEDYGVYPEPLVAALPQFGFLGRQLSGGKSELISELAAHHPVVVWIDLGYTSSFLYDINGEMVLMATKSHVVCAYGYNDEGVLISDPDSSRRKRVIPWDNFMRMWNSMDQYSLAVTLA
jgi:uncharacterized protein YgiM (DUF1202 family)/uncharacterized protein YvpB